MAPNQASKGYAYVGRMTRLTKPESTAEIMAKIDKIAKNEDVDKEVNKWKEIHLKEAKDRLQRVKEQTDVSLAESRRLNELAETLRCEYEADEITRLRAESKAKDEENARVSDRFDKLASSHRMFHETVSAGFKDLAEAYEVPKEVLNMLLSSKADCSNSNLNEQLVQLRSRFESLPKEVSSMLLSSEAECSNSSLNSKVDQLILRLDSLPREISSMLLSSNAECSNSSPFESALLAQITSLEVKNDHSQQVIGEQNALKRIADQKIYGLKLELFQAQTTMDGNQRQLQQYESTINDRNVKIQELKEELHKVNGQLEHVIRKHLSDMTSHRQAIAEYEHAYESLAISSNKMIDYVPYPQKAKDEFKERARRLGLGMGLSESPLWTSPTS